MSDKSAVAKFWRSPELVDKLLIFLDGGSILCLATCHDLTKKVSQKSSVWTKVVRSTCPDGTLFAFFLMDDKAFLRANKKKLAPLVELLKMAKDPSEMKLTLLEVISERFPNTAGEENALWGLPPGCEGTFLTYRQGALCLCSRLSAPGRGGVALQVSPKPGDRLS